MKPTCLYIQPHLTACRLLYVYRHYSSKYVDYIDADERNISDTKYLSCGCFRHGTVLIGYFAEFRELPDVKFNCEIGANAVERKRAFSSSCLHQKSATRCNANG